MKAVLVLFLIGLSFCKYDFKKHEKLVAHINKLKTTWTAKVTGLDIKPLIGTLPPKKGQELPRKKFAKKMTDFPESYDLRDVYPECETIREIRDQSNCGACWAFGAVEAMSDRLCIHTQGKLQTRVSAQNVCSCCIICGMG